MDDETFGLEECEVVAGDRSQIRFEGAERYPKHPEYPALTGKKVLRFMSVDDNGEQGSTRTILLFPKLISFLVGRIAAGVTSRDELRQRLRGKYRATYPALDGVDYDYINVARHLCHGYQNSDLPDDAPSGVALRNVLVRQGQAAFRQRVLVAYGARCAISRCTVASLLDAAHVVPFTKSKNHKIANGILLRTDLHTLFDLNLLRLRPAQGGQVRVHLAESLRADSTYTKLHGNTFTLPDAVRDGVLANLRTRYE